MINLKKYDQFILEGGNVFDTTRPILQKEVPVTLTYLDETFLRGVLGLEGIGKDVLAIGSAGKKPGPEEESGDIDIGIDIKKAAAVYNIDPDDVFEHIYGIIKDKASQYNPSFNKGLEVISIAFPIGAGHNGEVQVDLLPFKNIEWAKFIYESPDYKSRASVYKSAHRNWLLTAILSAIKKNGLGDKHGNIVSYTAYILKLNDGLFKVRKTYSGKRGRLKNPVTVKSSEYLITDSPEKLIDFLFGPGHELSEFGTFESTFNIMTRPDFKWKTLMPVIVDNFKNFLIRVGLTIPSEINKYDEHASKT